MTKRISVLLLAGVSVLFLAACSEEDTTVAQADPPATEIAPTEPTQPDVPEERDAGDALDRLREGAGSLLEGTEILGEEASERARQALEDAGPMLDRARDIFGEVGASVNEIAQQALRDLDRGVAALEERIDRAREERESADTDPAASDPAAVLAPVDTLNADTSAAARASAAGVGPAYVGVWAGDAKSCVMIDQEPVEMFAVITPTTIRRYESVCNFEEVQMEGGKAELAASCVAEGDEESRSIGLDMPSSDRLVIGNVDDSFATELTRCHLPD